MSEFAATTLSFPPVKGTWQDVMSRIDAYLQEQHMPATSLHREGKLLTVNADTRCIERRQSIDLWKPIGPEPKGVEYWRSFSVETMIDTNLSLVNFSVRGIEGQQTCVELWFPTCVHESIFQYDMVKKDFNPEAKGDLIRLFIALTKAIGAAGFGYRRAKEDSLFGPLAIETLCDYVETGSRWFSNREKFQLIVAGLASSFVEDTKFAYHDADHPFYYRQSGLYIFDLLWPSVEQSM